MLQLLITLMLFASVLNVAEAKNTKEVFAHMSGNVLSGNFNCELSNTLSSEVIKLKLVLSGRENLYEANFYDGKKMVIVGEGLHDPEFPDKFKMNYVHKIDGHTGIMNLNFSNERRDVGGNWYSFASFKLGSITCKKGK